MIAPLLLWGAGGHALALVDALQRNGVRVDAFAIGDGHSGRPDLTPLLRGDSELKTWLLGKTDARYLVAIGLLGTVRENIASKGELLGLTATRFIDRTSVISTSAHIGRGTQVLPFAFVGPGAHVGKHCIVNTGAKVEHEASVGDYCDLAPSATVLGRAAIGPRVLVGAGAVILPDVAVCAGSVIGAGAVVTKSIDRAGTYVGVPARFVR